MRGTVITESLVTQRVPCDYRGHSIEKGGVSWACVSTQGALLLCSVLASSPVVTGVRPSITGVDLLLRSSLS